jgi:hypothetical protein
MSFSKLLRLCIIGGIVIIVGKQLVLSFVLERAFDVGGFLLSIVYTAVMLGIPVYFTRINQREGGLLGLSPAHTLGFVLGFYLLYLILFFSRLIMLIDFFARNPFYLIVEFVMMVGVLTALSMPFIIAGRKVKHATEAKRVEP